MAFYEKCPRFLLLIMGLQLIDLFNFVCLEGFIRLQIIYYLCSSFEPYFAYFYFLDYLDPKYFEFFFLPLLPMIATSYQALLNFVKLYFYQELFLRFYLIFIIMSYFLFVIFLNLCDLLLNF